MAEKRYSFDGKELTAAEVSRIVTAYSQPWIGAALKAGCRSVADLHIYAQQRQVSQRKGNVRGMQRTRKLHPHWGGTAPQDKPKGSG